MNFEQTFSRLTLMGWVLLFAYVSLVPFYYFQPVQLEFNRAAVTFLKYLPFFFISLLSIWALLGYFLKFFRYRLGVIDLYSSGFLVVCVVSLVEAVYPSIGFWKVVYYTTTGIYLPCLLVGLIRSKPSLYALIHWMVGIAALVSFYGLFVYVVGVDYFFGRLYITNNPYYSDIGRMASTLGNASYVGAYLSLCLPYCLWQLDFKEHAFAKIVRKGMLLVLLAGIGLTFTRGAWLATAIAGGIYLYPRRRGIVSYVKDHFSIQRFGMAVMVIFLVIPILEGIGFREPMHRGWHRFWGRMDQTFLLSNAESYRVAQYHTTWRVLEAHPFLGVGFGNFTRQYDLYKSPNAPQTGTTTTENIYLMIACETGVVGLMVFACLLFAILKYIYRFYHQCSCDTAKRLALASLASLSGALVNMGTWDALNQPTVRMTFWMIVGIALCQIQLARSTKKHSD